MKGGAKALGKKEGEGGVRSMGAIILLLFRN